MQIKMRPILAEKVTRGNKLWLSSSGDLPNGDFLNTSSTHSFFSSPVTQVRKVFRNGMHAPLTEDGSLVVDGGFLSCHFFALVRSESTRHSMYDNMLGILASSYAKVHSLTWGNYTLFHGHDINMQMHAPLRLACSCVPSLCSDGMHSDEGRHAFTQFLLTKLSWLSAMNTEYHDLRSALVERPTVVSVVSVIVQLFAAILLRLFFGKPDFAFATIASTYAAMLAHRRLFFKQ